MRGRKITWSADPVSHRLKDCGFSTQFSDRGKLAKTGWLGAQVRDNGSGLGVAPTAGERPDGSWRARVLILAASAIYGDGLATLAARSQRIDVIGAEAISPDVLARIGALRPDVVVLDVATSENLRLAYQIRVVPPTSGWWPSMFPSRTT